MHIIITIIIIIIIIINLQLSEKRNSLYCSFYCERSFVCLIYHSVERKEKQNVVLSLL